MKLRLLFLVLLPSLALGAKYPLTDDDLKTYSKSGYLLVEEVFSDDEINQIKQLAQQILDHAKQLIDEEDHNKNGSEIKRDEQGTQFVYDTKNNAIKRIVWACGMIPDFKIYGTNRKLTTMVYQILQTSPVYYLINQLHPKMPGDGVEYRFHRDIENRQALDPKWAGETLTNGGFVQSLTALEDISESNGAIEIYPGSHNESTPLKTRKETQEEIAKDLQKKYSPEFVRMQPGDVLLCHPNLAHRSLPNQSDKSRLLFINGFAAKEAHHPEIKYPGDGSAYLLPIEE